MGQQRNNEYDVFISYARKDYVDENKIVIPDNAIVKLTKAFDKSDISYWIDEKGIYSGDRFAKLIANSIKNSKVFLFISSAFSNASEWTVGEIAVAREYKKKIIPFRIDNSEYNENVIVYLAPLDYVSYDNAELAIAKVVESINEYKEYLKKKKEEEERRVAEETAKQIEKERLEWELQQKEIHRKESERLAAISEERKKKEEELNTIYDQLHNLDTEISEEIEKKLQLENDIRTIENKLSLMNKQRDNLEARRKYLEKHFDVYPQENSVAEDVSLNIDLSKKLLVKSTMEQKLEEKHIFIDKRWYIAAIVLCAIIIVCIVCVKRCGVDGYEGVLVGDTIEVNEDCNENESIFELVPVEDDIVYGISTVGRIKNWNDLRVLLDGESNKLHKVSFAFIKVMEGVSDANYVHESEKNREDALNAGIRVALYHTLNIRPDQKIATGKAQAKKYYQYVKTLNDNELPPVLIVPQLKFGQESCAIQRCNEWIDEIKRLYNVKPIVNIGLGNYKSDFHGKLHDCIMWMDENPVVSPTFIQMSEKKVRYYNGTQPYEEDFQNWRLSSFSGSYGELQKFN